MEEKDKYNKTLSQNLKNIRRNRGLTTIDLAKILGVSQAKISYIENGKGVLSARDVAVLADKLEVPVTEFFKDLDHAELASDRTELIAQLVYYGAEFLTKPSRVPLKEVPFEDVISKSLGFVEDDRLHKGFCAALINQAASKEINAERIFALIGNNPFLIGRIAYEIQFCLRIIDKLKFQKVSIRSRAKRQLQKILKIAQELRNRTVHSPRTPFIEFMGSLERSLVKDELDDITSFVEKSLNAKD